MASTNAERATVRGLGLAASVSEQVILGAAREVSRRGFHSFWLNNPPGETALRTLGEVGRQVPGIWLGVGVIPLSHESGGEIASHLEREKLPLERFYVGIGSGSGAGGVERVAEGISSLRPRLDCRIVVAALGPKMCRLAGEQADGVLFNWLTPEWAERSARLVQESAERAGRPAPRLMTYVRTALGEGAAAKLREEAGRYESIPQYAAHFQRMDASGFETSVTGATPSEIREGLARWNEVVDEVVVRAITEHDTSEELSELIDASRP